MKHFLPATAFSGAGGIVFEGSTSKTTHFVLNEKPAIITGNSPATGTYTCARCGSALFEATKKFEAGCGFPSFWQHLGNQVIKKPLDTYGRKRIQLLCHHCGLHLGHLFTHKHTPTGLRYCISHTALQYQEVPTGPAG